MRTLDSARIRRPEDSSTAERLSQFAIRLCLAPCLMLLSLLALRPVELNAADTRPQVAAKKPAPAPVPRITTVPASPPVYVPAEELTDLMSAGVRRVLLDRQQFESMLQAAGEAQLLQTSPQATVVSHCEYAGTIMGDQLVLRITATLEHLRDGWQVWQFALPRLLVEQIQLDGEPLLATTGEHESLMLATRKRGTHHLTLQVSTALASVGGDRMAGFSLIPSATGELTLTVPAGKRLIVDQIEQARPADLEQSASYRVAVGGKEKLQLQLSDSTTSRAADALIFATTRYGVGVSPGTLTWRAVTTLQVFGRPLDQWTLSIPGTLEITDVESVGLEAWTLSEDPRNPERTQIHLIYGQAFDGDRQIRLSGVMPVATGNPFAIPPLVIEGVTSHVGQMLVRYHPSLRLQVIGTEGVRRATLKSAMTETTADMDVASESLQQLAFDVWNEEFDLRMALEPKGREVHAALAMVVELNDAELALQGALTVTPRHQPLFDVDIDHLAEWSVDTVVAQETGLALPWRIVELEPGRSRLRVSFPEALSPESSATLQIAWRRVGDGWPVEEQPLTLSLPELTVPQASLMETVCVVTADPALELVPENLEGFDLVPLKGAMERLRLQSQELRYSGQIKVTRRRSSFAVEMQSFYRLDRQTLTATFEAAVTIQGGGQRELDVLLPEAVGEDVQFRVVGATLVQQPITGVVNGKRRWNLRFAERVIGTIAVLTDITLPRTAAGAAQTCPSLEIPGAERVYGALLVEGTSDQRLQIQAVDGRGAPLQELDLLEIKPSLYQLRDRLVGAYRTIGSGNSLTLTEQRFDRAHLPTAIGQSLKLESVLSPSGRWHQQAVFSVLLTGIKQLRLELPAEARLWSVMVDDEPVEVRGQETTSLIPVSLTANSQTPVKVTVIYEMLDDPLAAYGELIQTPPQVSAVTSDGAIEPVEMLEQTWTLAYPDSFDVVENRSAWEWVERPSGVTWPAWLGQFWRLPTVNEALTLSLIMAGIVAGFATLILAYRHLTWRQLVGVAAGGAILGCVILGLTSVAVRQGKAPMTGSAVTAGTDFYYAAPAQQLDRLPEYEDRPRNAPASGPVPDLSKPAAVSRLWSDSEPQSPMAPPSPAMAEAKGEVAAAAQPPRKAAPAAGEDRAGLAAGKAEKAGERLGLADKKAKATGLLSLHVALEVPASSRVASLRYAGAEGASHPTALSLRYRQREQRQILDAVAFAFGLLCGWWARRLSTARSLAWVAFLLMSATALVFLGLPLPEDIGNLLFSFAIGHTVAWVMGQFARGLQAIVAPAETSLSTGVRNVLVMLSIAGAGQTPVQAQDAQHVPPAPVAPPRPENVIYVYDDPARPLDANRVLVPLQQYRELYQRLHPAPEASPLQTPASIVEATHRATLEQKGEQTHLVITSRLTIMSTLAGSRAVELPMHGVAIEHATLDSGPATVVASGVPWKILVTGQGLHIADLTWRIPVQGNREAGSVRLSFGRLPAALLGFHLPTPQTSVRLNGSTSAYRRVSHDGVAAIEFAVDRGGDLQMSWLPEQAQGGSAVIHVESSTEISVSDRGLAATYGLQYRIRQGVVRDISLSLPETLRLQHVVGPDVGGWELVGEGAVRKLRIFFKRNVADSTALSVHGFVARQVPQDEPFTVPQLVPEQVTADAGAVAVSTIDAYSVRGLEATGLNQVDPKAWRPAHKTDTVPAPPQLAYRFARRPWSLQVQFRRITSRVKATLDHGVLVGRSKLQHRVRASCELLQMALPSISLEIPQEWVVLEVHSPGLSDWYLVENANEARQLVVEWESPREGTVDVVLSATSRRNQTETLMTVETPGLAGAEIRRRRLGLWFDEGLTGDVTDPGMWKGIDVDSLTDDWWQSTSRRAQLAFQSTETRPAPLQLLISSAQPRLTGTSLSVVNVTDVALVYGLVLQWQIDRAATDELLVELPAWLNERLQFRSPEIREATAESVDAQIARWRIRLRSPLLGKINLVAEASLPPATERVPGIAPRFIRSTDGVSAPLLDQKHYVLLVNTSLSELVCQTPEDVEPAQGAAGGIVIRQSLLDQATEFVQLLKPGVAPFWSMNRYQRQAQIPAAVNLAEHTTVVARDGSYRTLSRFTIKNRNRQFLAVKLPPESRLQSVFVNDSPSRAVSTTIGSQPVFLLALPKGSAADRAFPVRIVFSGWLGHALPDRGEWLGREADLIAAEAVSQQESEELGIPTARTLWNLYLPDDLVASPLSDARRHNLALASEDDRNEAAVLLLLTDADELLSAASEKSNNVYRERAIKNLKEIQSQLDLFSTQGLPNQDQRAQQESLGKALVQLEQESLIRENTLNEPQSQAVSSGSGSKVDQDGDVAVQLQRAFGNNAVLLSDNGIDSRVTNGTETEAITDQFLRLPALTGKEQDLRRKDAAKDNQRSLAGRNRYQELNESNLQRFGVTIRDEAAATRSQLGDNAKRASGGMDSLFDKPAEEQLSQRPRGDFSGEGLSAASKSGLMDAFLGAGGGLGGGMGGGGIGGGLPGAALEFKGRDDAWSAGGYHSAGLSLDMEVPLVGHKLVFSKAGSDARLALHIVSRDRLERTAGWGVAGFCLALIAGMVVVGRSAKWRAVILSRMPLLLAVASAIAAVFLVFPGNIAAMTAFVAFSALSAWQWRQVPHRTSLR